MSLILARSISLDSTFKTTNKLSVSERKVVESGMDFCLYWLEKGGVVTTVHAVKA
jgi:hypothetical protein